MRRFWFISTALAVPFALHCGAAPAHASFHCNVTIIMTTLGTDGTTTVQSIDHVPSADGAAAGNTGTSNSGVPSKPTVNPATNNDSNGNASGGGAGGSGGPNKGQPRSGGPGDSGNLMSPTAATGNDDPVTTTEPDTGTPDTTTDNGPEPPPPPVLDPTDTGTSTNETDTDIPIPVPGSNPTTTNNPSSVAETPEPGTLTLLAIGAIGGCGYFRRRRK